MNMLLLSCFSRVLLCDPIDGSPPGSPVPEILQARSLEWVAISFSNAWKWNVKVKSLSRARLFVTPWTAAYQAPPSMGFSRKEYWSGLPLPSPKKKKKKSDTCSLFPPFGDPWPSFLLASQHAFLSSIHPFLGSSILKNEDFPDGAVVKNPSAMQETQRYRFSFWVRKIPEVGNGSTIQYSCLGNPTDRGAWWATDHQVAKNWTWLNDWARKQPLEDNRIHLK